MKPVSSRSLYENINPFPTNNFKCGMDFSWMPKTVCPKWGFSKVLYVVLVLIFSPLLEIPWFTQHWKWVTWNQNVWKACSLKCLQSLTIQVSPTEVQFTSVFLQKPFFSCVCLHCQLSWRICLKGVCSEFSEVSAVKADRTCYETSHLL